MSRYALDTEFIDDGEAIHLISVGVVDIDDPAREFYGEVVESEVPWLKASEWVLGNVRPHLIGGGLGVVMYRAELAAALREYIDAGTGPIQVWGDCPAYDWVVVSQLYGPLINRPAGWPFNAFDIRQYAFHVGAERSEWPVQVETEHHALADARWTAEVVRWLDGRGAGR